MDELVSGIPKTGLKSKADHHSHSCPVCQNRWDCAGEMLGDSCGSTIEAVCGECDPIGG